MVSKEDISSVLNAILKREYGCYVNSEKDGDNVLWLAATLSTVREIAKELNVKINNVEVK